MLRLRSRQTYKGIFTGSHLDQKARQIPNTAVSESWVIYRASCTSIRGPAKDSQALTLVEESCRLAVVQAIVGRSSVTGSTHLIFALSLAVNWAAWVASGCVARGHGSCCGHQITKSLCSATVGWYPIHRKAAVTQNIQKSFPFARWLSPIWNPLLMPAAATLFRHDIKAV